jgi:hypothetical protein
MMNKAFRDAKKSAPPPMKHLQADKQPIPLGMGLSPRPPLSTPTINTLSLEPGKSHYEGNG